MSNEKFLFMLVLISAIIIGALGHTIFLQHRLLKESKFKCDTVLKFVDKVLQTIAYECNIDVQYYIDKTNNVMKGGDNHE